MRLTPEDLQKIIKIEKKQRGNSYPPNLELLEMKLYKLTLLGSIHTVEGYGPVVTVRNNADGLTYSLWLRTVLYKKITDLKVNEGSIIGVIYKGNRPSSRGKDYYDYSVFIWTGDAEKLLENQG